MQSCLFCLHRFCLPCSVRHDILCALCVYLDLIIVLALIIVQRKLYGLNCAALQLRQFRLASTISILAMPTLLGEAGREHDARVLRYSYIFICYNRPYNVGICDMHCFIIAGCPSLTCTDVLQCCMYKQCLAARSNQHGLIRYIAHRSAELHPSGFAIGQSINA